MTAALLNVLTRMPRDAARVRNVDDDDSEDRRRTGHVPRCGARIKGNDSSSPGSVQGRLRVVNPLVRRLGSLGAPQRIIRICPIEMVSSKRQDPAVNVESCGPLFNFFLCMHRHNFVSSITPFRMLVNPHSCRWLPGQPIFHECLPHFESLFFAR